MDTVGVALLIMQAARGLAALLFVLSLIIAFTHWATRKGSINAFGSWARFVRRWSDSILKRVERRVVRSGGNPQDAPAWLIAGAVVAGLVLIAAVGWVLNFALGLVDSFRQHNGSTAYLLLNTIIGVLMIALVIRAVGSWFGIGRFTRGMKPIFVLTDWLLAPIQALLPATGGVDFSPMVAYFLLYFLQNMLLPRIR